MESNSLEQAKTDAPLITLDSVTLKIRNKSVYEGTNWRINQNQQWAIIGPNGSGKSLLACAIMRSVPLSHGQVLYHFDPSRPPCSYYNQGEIVKVSPESHQQLVGKAGYHQARWNSIGSMGSPTVAQRLTGRSIEGFTPFHVGPTRVDETIYLQRRDEALQLLGIEYLLGRKITHLSNGEARKVLLVRALMQSPKLLILDDPFGGLDAQSRETLKLTIDEMLATTGMRILLITARSDEIPSGITHVVRVSDNQIVEKGILQSILQSERYASKTSSPEHPPHPVTPDFPVSPVDSKESFPTLVTMTDVSVSYGEVQILQDLNWRMKQGENWAISGPNGAGKTTFLSLILADNPQSYANDITLFGRRRGSGESIWEIKEKIGWVSPELRLFYNSNTTCVNVVCSGFFDSVGLYKECSEEQFSLAHRWMRSFGIAALAERRFGSVSVGEQRLVLLTRALVKNPLLLILDEPCQGLDSQNRSLIIDLLDSLCQQVPINMIFVTHHLDELPRTITHLLELRLDGDSSSPRNSPETDQDKGRKDTDL